MATETQAERRPERLDWVLVGDFLARLPLSDAQSCNRLVDDRYGVWPGPINPPSSAPKPSGCFDPLGRECTNRCNLGDQRLGSV